jgi:DNA polymerase-3 subunit delta
VGAGGDISSEASVKPWELPKWVTAQARVLGLELDSEAARSLIQCVGDRQQRLVRELEKLALAAPTPRKVDVADIEILSARSAERRAWSLADALVSADQQSALKTYVALRSQGERLPGLIYWMSQRLRTAHEAASALDRGESAAQLKRRLRMPAKAADRLIDDARRAGADRLQRGIEEIADLELASRGGGRGAAAEDTAAVRAIARIAG